ncbi:hypothetical protein MKW94_010816 [Papaver nudicaule]|uniref:CCT-eta n=1 Tax=Papaver nudicaule TaxID=74823 RepID=A0AA41S2Y2_PAPNU|nr:hypothetical protein [Papaver nudicaule]
MASKKDTVCAVCKQGFHTLLELSDHYQWHRSVVASKGRQFERLKLLETEVQESNEKFTKKRSKTRNIESNSKDDGSNLLDLLDSVHSSSEILVDIISSRHPEVGDETTTVVLLCGEFLKESKPLIKQGVSAESLARSFLLAAKSAKERIAELAVSIDDKLSLAKCASTALTSKYIGGNKEFLSGMVVDAITTIGNNNRPNSIGIVKVPGGTLRDSFLANGVAFKKSLPHAGFEQGATTVSCPTILIVKTELQLKSEQENTEIRFFHHFQSPSVIYRKLEKCIRSGAKIVLSCFPIDDLAAKYLADQEIFCTGHCSEEDLQRVAAATGAVIQDSVENLIDKNLGTCELFEEMQVGYDILNIFSGCSLGETATIVLRGGANQLIEESVCSLNNAIILVNKIARNPAVVPGGGAIDMEISRYLRQYALTIAGKSQQFINCYAKAFEVIPRQLCDNAGIDSDSIIIKLRQKHTGEGSSTCGVDVSTGGIVDSFANFIWEPAALKMKTIDAATESACHVLTEMN